jgi:hypothetical protein
MTNMSLEVELMLFGRQIPFIAERRYHHWPEIGKGGEKKPANKWDALAMLLNLQGDNSNRKVLRASRNAHAADVVRVETFYNRGDHAGDYDYLIASGAVDELLADRLVEGTPKWGYTDMHELKITERGMRALVDHIAQLEGKEKIEEK